MKEFDPNRTIPVEEWATSREDEELLLLDPMANVSALYELYEVRAKVHLERMESGVDSAASDLFDALERMKLISKLLPDDDPRSYAAWKRKFCSPGEQQ